MTGNTLAAGAASVYLGIRALGLAVVAFLLWHGAYQRAHEHRG